MSSNFALGLWMLLSSTSPSSRSPISLSRHLFSLLQPSFQWCRCCSQAACGGVSQGARQRQAHLPLAHSLSLLHSKFTSRLKVQGRMRGGLDQAKADLNSILEAIQFLSPHHPPTFDAFVLGYTVAVHDTVLFCGSPQDLGRQWTASKDLGFGHHPQLSACRKSRQEARTKGSAGSGSRVPAPSLDSATAAPRFGCILGFGQRFPTPSRAPQPIPRLHSSPRDHGGPGFPPRWLSSPRRPLTTASHPQWSSHLQFSAWKAKATGRNSNSMK